MNPAYCGQLAVALDWRLVLSPERRARLRRSPMAVQAPPARTEADPAGASRFERARRALNPGEWLRVGGMALTVVGLNVVGWGMLALAAGGNYHINRTEVFGFGTGLLAYTLGMRHAFDADHISAIDNTTRKLLNDGQTSSERRLFLFARPLDGCVLACCPPEFRYPRSRCSRCKTVTPLSSTPPTSSARAYRLSFCSSLPPSTS